MVTMTQKPLKHGLKVALYQPDIPQNTASIIRTCSCLGASLEIIEPCGFLFSDKRFKRVVMDYLDYSEIKFYKSPKEFFDENSKNRVVLMTTKASKVYTKFKLSVMIYYSLAEKVQVFQTMYILRLMKELRFQC